MSFPNFPNKYELESLLNPQDIVNYRRHLGGLERIGSPEGIIFVLERSLPKRMRWRIPVRKVGGMNGDVYLVKKTRSKVAVVVNIGGGSPIVVELAEEFVALGAKRMVLVTWGGALQPDLKAGDIVVCNRALRDEGTSHHYLPPEKYISADEMLVSNLASAIQARGGISSIGTTWTIDAPYRETREEVLQYKSEGVKTVEMESAGLFTVGKVRAIQTASVVVVMDSMANLRWEVPDKLEGIIRSLEIVYAAAIDVLGDR